MHPDAKGTEPRLRVSYDLACGGETDAAERAREIALEQTVELPEGTFGDEIERFVVGRVEAIERVDSARWRAVVSYDTETIGDEIPQLLNLLFGNISLKQGIRISEIDWPEGLLGRFPGPRHGVEGLRALCGVTERRALLCTALKPMGLSTRELARRAHDFALGGIDLIKDDHGLGNQTSAPFEERLFRCQEAIALANSRSGGNSLYFPNVTGRASELEQRVELAKSVGCRGFLISPLAVGPDTVRWLAERFGLAVLAHPSLAGAFLHSDHGIAAEILLGQIFRMLGSDGVIYPNVGGRFPFTEETCSAINSRLRGPLGSLLPSFPVPAGGIDVSRVPHWISRYGPDTIFLVSGSLYVQRDLVRASRDLVEAVRRLS